MAPSRRSFSSSAIALEQPDRHAVEERAAVDLTVELAVLERPLKREYRVRSAACPTRDPSGTLALNVRPISPSLPEARPFAVSLPVARSESNARSFRARSKSKSAAPVAKVPSAVQRRLVVEDPELVRGEPGLPARQTAGDAGFAFEQIVDRLVADPQSDATPSIVRSKAPPIGSSCRRRPDRARRRVGVLRAPRKARCSRPSRRCRRGKHSRRCRRPAGTLRPLPDSSALARLHGG